MSSVSPLIPAILGILVLVPVIRTLRMKGFGMNRKIVGSALIFFGLCIWLSSAMSLVYEGRISLLFTAFGPAAFFGGIAWLMPPPENPLKPTDQAIPGRVLIWTGVTLGFAHFSGLILLPVWRETVLRAYAAVGIHH